MTKSQIKIATAGFAYMALMFAARAAGATDVQDMNIGADMQAGILSAMFRQMLNNPSSGIVIGALCVMGWLVDDLPFINSRYVAHILVFTGATTFRFFCLESSVPKYFPHPQAVFICNGIIAGFFAWGIHRQAVARAINFFRMKSGAADPDQKRTELKPTSIDSAPPFNGTSFKGPMPPPFDATKL